MTVHPTRTRRRTAFAALLVPVMLGSLLASAPSHAESLSSRDGARDTWREVSGGGYRAVDVVENIDVRKIQVQHRQNRVWTRGTFAQLSKQPRQGTWLSLQTWDGEGSAYFQALMYVGPEYRDGYFRLVRRVVGGEEADRACPGAQMAVDYRKDTMTMSLPRACVDSPASLRWKAETYSPRGIGTDDEQYLTDDAVSNRSRSQRWEPGLRRG